MAEETEQAEGQIQDESESQTTVENAPEGDAGSPPVEVEDWQGKYRAAEEQRIRLEERSRYLEQTNRLQEEHARRQSVPTHQELSAELAELDKTLEPIFAKRLKSQIDPLGNNMAAVMDSLDAQKFEMYLMRNGHSDVIDNEDSYNRTMQQVEQVRQQAAQAYGKYLSRVDAFVYLQGLEGVKEKAKTKAGKKTVQVKEEAKRQLQIQATQSGETGAGFKKVTLDVDSLRRKMMSGERLTSEERAKFKKSLEGQSF